MAGSDVVKFDPSAYPILANDAAENNNLAEIMAENVGDAGMGVFDLDHISLPTGGGSTWEVETLNGSEARKEIEGIVVLWTTPRSYWEKGLDDPDSGGSTPPDCASEDGKLGYGVYGVGSDLHPSGECKSCPMNEWGSDPKGGRGKACAEQRLLFMLLPGGVLPISVTIPPTSLKSIKKYMLRLTGRAIPYYGVVTRLGLEQTKNAQGIKYSVVVPNVGDTLDEQTKQRAKGYGVQLRQMLNSFVREAATTTGNRPPPPAPADEPASDAAY